MNNINSRIAFLFGSGISIKAKIPSTEKITHTILDSKDIVRGSAENFFFDNPKRFDWSLYKDIPERVQIFLKILKTEIELYYNNVNRTINYEDIYFLLDFIEYNYYEEEGNPAFKYIFKEFEPKIKNLLIPLDPSLEDSFNMNRLLSESKMFIKQTVSKLLSKKAESFDALKFLFDSLLDNEIRSFDIFTLNHDIVLEQFFELNKIDYNDGFQTNRESINIWNPQLFNKRDKVKLYKIHGSVNWQYYNQESWKDNRIKKFPISLLDKFDTISNALILIGTQNKMSDYIKDLYLELYYHFYQSLNNNNCLIIVGYGFNDRGINQKIYNWLYNPSNRVLIIDPNVEGLKVKFPSLLFGQWNENRNIKRIQDYIENVSWDTIKYELNQSSIAPQQLNNKPT